MSYTPSMKTAISIPDPVFEGAKQLAHRLKKSRSQLYSEAVADYVARHSPDEVTAAMNRALAEVGDEPDEFVRTAARRVLVQTEW